jgi:hypothetical protein
MQNLPYHDIDFYSPYEIEEAETPEYKEFMGDDDPSIFFEEYEEE